MDISYTKLPGTSQNVRQSGQVEQLFGTFLQGDNIPYRILYKLIDDKIAHKDMSTFSGGHFEVSSDLTILTREIRRGLFKLFASWYGTDTCDPLTPKKNENTSQNDTTRHRKIQFGTVRNRKKMRKWQKNARKLQEKSVRNRTREFFACSFNFSHFSPV